MNQEKLNQTEPVVRSVNTKEMVNKMANLSDLIEIDPEKYITIQTLIDKYLEVDEKVDKESDYIDVLVNEYSAEKAELEKMETEGTIQVNTNIKDEWPEELKTQNIMAGISIEGGYLTLDFPDDHKFDHSDDLVEVKKGSFLTIGDLIADYKELIRLHYWRSRKIENLILECCQIELAIRRRNGEEI